MYGTNNQSTTKDNQAGNSAEGPSLHTPPAVKGTNVPNPTIAQHQRPPTAAEVARQEAVNKRIRALINLKTGGTPEGVRKFIDEVVEGANRVVEQPRVPRTHEGKK